MEKRKVENVVEDCCKEIFGDGENPNAGTERIYISRISEEWRLVTRALRVLAKPSNLSSFSCIQCALYTTLNWFDAYYVYLMCVKYHDLMLSSGRQCCVIRSF